MTHTRDWGSRQIAISIQDAEVAGSDLLLDGPKRFVHETLVMPDDEKLEWYYVDTPPSVMVVPVLPDGQLVMVYQYRWNLKRYTLEFPAGEVNGETVEAAARRELAEETGYQLAPGGRWRPLGTFYSLPSETNKLTTVLLAEPVISTGPATKDAEIERYFNMTVHIVTPGLAVSQIGESVAGTETISALLLARSRL